MKNTKHNYRSKTEREWKKKIFTYFFIFFTPLVSFSDPGDLIEYNFQNTFSISTLNIFLNSLGNSATNVMYPISVYDIKYESIDHNGSVDTLSGLISFPHSNLDAFPILTYQHGTLILDSQAPSNTGMSVNNYEVLFVGLGTTPAGFITVMPDYVGIGNPHKFHPYMIADSHTRSVVDILRATKKLSLILEDTYQYNDQLFLIGYSDGGYATLASHRGIENFYNQEFNITASFPMAGPYDLSGTMVDYFLSGPDYSQPYYVPYVLTSQLWYYQGLEVDFSNYFEPFWADTLPGLFDGTHSGDFINNLMPEDPLDILLLEVLEEFENSEDHFFRQKLDLNTLLDWIPQNPIHFFHGMGDDIVPYENTQIAYDTFVGQGAQNITLTLYPESFGGHAEVAGIALSAGLEAIFDYQIISSKGDLNGDQLLTLDDMGILSSGLLGEINLTPFQQWGSDIDFTNSISIIDLILLSDSIQ